MNNDNANVSVDGLLYAVIGILVCLVVLFGGYFVYKEYVEPNKSNNTNETTKDTKDATKDTTTETKTETKTETNTQTEVKDFDLSKFDYTKVIDGYPASDKYEYKIDLRNHAEQVGISASLKDSKKEVIITIDWSNYNEYVEGSNRTGVKTYSVTNFTGKVKEVVTVGFGLAAGDEYVFYLMEDGTVEYTPIGNTFRLNNESNITLKSLGKVPTVKDVVKVVQASGYSNCEGCVGGGYTALGIKADGTFYDLGKLLSN